MNLPTVSGMRNFKMTKDMLEPKESMQDFCRRILQVVRAASLGKAIEYKCGDEWIEGDVSSFHRDSEYRIKRLDSTPLPITPEMWEMIDIGYNYIVLTHPGWEPVISQAEPKLRGDGMWEFKDAGNFHRLPIAVDLTDVVPESSLTRRPLPQPLKNI